MTDPTSSSAVRSGAPADARHWSVRAAIWGGIVVTSLAGAVVLSHLSAEAIERALEASLRERVVAEGSLLAFALQTSPESAPSRAAELARAGGLADARLVTGGALEGESEAVRRAYAAATRGELLTVARVAGEDGPHEELEVRAFVPLADGRVVEVVGRDGTETMDRLELLQGALGLVFAVLAGALGAVLGAAVQRPLERLDRGIEAAARDARPEAIPVGGPAEVRRVALAVRALLVGIRDRDASLAAAHAAQIAERERLAAAVAHEVRNPLSALALTVRRIAASPEADRRDSLAEWSEHCVHEIDAIVDRLFALTRPIEARPTTVDLAAVVASAAVAAPLDVRVSGRGEGVADPDLLAQVLRNLLRNASEAGATNARVVVEPASVLVEDDGPGVKEPERVFEWAWSGGAGTGLGLPQARRLCEAMGARIFLEASHPARFRVQLRAS